MKRVAIILFWLCPLKEWEQNFFYFFTVCSVKVKIWYICSNWSLGNEIPCIKKGSVHLHTNTCGIGFWFIFYYLRQNTPCTLYFCTEGKTHYELSWGNFWNTWYCCLHPSWSKKGYFATRAHRFLSLPKVSYPLVCSAASSRERKLTGEPRPVDPRRFGVVLVLVFRSRWLSQSITRFTGHFGCPVSLTTMTYIPLPSHVSLVREVSE